MVSDSELVLEIIGTEPGLLTLALHGRMISETLQYNFRLIVISKDPLAWSKRGPPGTWPSRRRQVCPEVAFVIQTAFDYAIEYHESGYVAGEKFRTR